MFDTYQRGVAALYGGRSGHGSIVIGWNIADYNWGESQVLQMNTYFNAVGRPKQFEAAAESIWKSYEDAKSAWAIKDIINASEMKGAGDQAVALRKQIEAFVAQNKKSTGGGSVSVPDLSPVGVPDAPRPKEEGILSIIPWWGWAVGGVGVVGLLGTIVIPIVAPLIAAGASRRLIPSHGGAR